MAGRFFPREVVPWEYPRKLKRKASNDIYRGGLLDRVSPQGVVSLENPVDKNATTGQRKLKKKKVSNGEGFDRVSPQEVVPLGNPVATTSQRKLKKKKKTNYGTVGKKNYVLVSEVASNGKLFLAKPLLGPLVFENDASDARDHCANERNFLSWLRLSITLAVVSVAVITNFHFTQQPTPLEKKISFPLGLVFWCLSLISLFSGLGNYLKTVRKYSRQTALVQTGWRTQLLAAVVAISVIAFCVLFLIDNFLAPK